MKHLRAYLYIIGIILVMAVTGCMLRELQVQRMPASTTPRPRPYRLADFPIRSSYVWGPMGPMFNNELKDKFASNTQLIQVSRNGDLKIEGEITQYSQRNKSVSAEGYSAQTELSITSKRTLHQHQEPYRGLRKAVYICQDLRHHSEPCLGAGRAGNPDYQGPGRPDIQRYGS